VKGRPCALRYRQFAPSPGLSPFVSSYWVIAAEGPPPGCASMNPAEPRPMRIRVVPDCCMDMVFHFSGEPERPGLSRDGRQFRPGAFLAGASLTSSLLKLPADYRAAGVRFRPGGATPFIGAPAHLFTSGGAGLAELMPEFSSLALSLAGEASSALETARVLDRLLLERLRLAGDVDALAARALGELARFGGRVEAAADRMGVGLKRLERAMKRHVGLTAKGAARSLRLVSAMRVLAGRAALPGLTDGSLAGLALALGFADQAHFTNEFSALAGISPAAWREERSNVDFLQYLPRPLY